MTAISGPGTAEPVWRPHLSALSPLLLEPAPARVVVVAPHPDDEVLGVGGLLSLLATAGTQVEVVAVTDGEASNPGGTVAPGRLAVLRRAETVAALEQLGVRAPVRHLHLPDGGAAPLERPVGQVLADDRSALGPGTWLLGPWALDGHPDHEAVGRACATAAARTGARLLAFPVWAWHWGTPQDLPWGRALRVDLPPAARSAKARAVDAFVSQTTALGPLPADAPVLPAHVLARFARSCEVVFV